MYRSLFQNLKYLLTLRACYDCPGYDETTLLHSMIVLLYKMPTFTIAMGPTTAVMSQRPNISPIRANIVKCRYSYPVTSNIYSFDNSKGAAPMVPKTRVLESSSKNRTLWDATKSLCLRYCWITKIHVVHFIKGTVMKCYFTFFLIFLYIFESILLRLYDFMEFHRIDIKFSQMNYLC